MRRRNMMDTKQRFSLRKSNLGVVSVMVGMTMFLAPAVHAQTEVTEPMNTATNDTVATNEVAATDTSASSTMDDSTASVYVSEPENVTVDIIAEGERRALFTEDWAIHRGDVENGQAKDLDVSEWKHVDLPNDYSIDQPFDDKYEAESGFLPGGVQWYRKSFVVGEKYKDKTITIEFDGAYMNSEVYLNGKKLGDHPNGYTAFSFDLTPDLVMDGQTENVLAVKTDNRIPSSRWYSGSGIYRDVHITVTDKVHVGYYGTKVEAPNLETQKNGDVTVNVSANVQNDSKEARTVVVKQQLLDTDGKVVATSDNMNVNVPAGGVYTAKQVLTVNKPKLWDLDSPNMYKVRTTVMDGDKLLDTYDTDYGFRYFNFERETGFSLNGKRMKLKGVSMHHDQGSLGAVANPAAIDRQVRILKEMGTNAIRVTHNPAASTLIDSANRHGMLIINEAFDGWSLPKNTNTHDYSVHFNRQIGADNRIVNGKPNMTWAEYDIKSMIHTSKNAPSVIMWSLGNELTEGATGNPADFPNIARNLVKWVKEVDDTRKITLGNNRLHGDTILTQVEEVIHEAGGIIGKNYKSPEQLAETRRLHPDWILYGSETASAIHSRGIYNTYGRDNRRLQMSEYDNDHARVGWGASASTAWDQVIRNDWNAGEFVWTGFDYIGEPTPWNGTGPGSVSNQGAKPKSSYFGIIDTAGFPKETYYLYRSLWNDKSHTLNLMSTWNSDEIARTRQGKVQVDVFTDAHRVELYLNGTKIDEATATETTTPAGYTYKKFGNQFYPTFYTDWAAGTLSVRAYDKSGKEITSEAVGRKEVKTSGEAASLKTTVERREVTADGRDLAYVTVEVLDANGIPVPAANNRIKFDVQGPGKIVGVDNGNPTDTDSYKADNRRAFSGKALVIVQTTKDAGAITLNATSDNLKSSSVALTSTRPTTDTKKYVQSYDISKNYYTYTGMPVSLPETLNVHYNDGTSKNVKVTWDAVDAGRYNTVGAFAVNGRLEGVDVKPRVNINVISPIVAVENYATMATTDKQPKLPELLRSIDSTGSYNINVPVQWNTQGIDFATAGIKTVTGTANVLNKVVPVKAMVRVIEAPEVAGNIARNASDMPTITNGYKQPNGQIVDLGTTAISDKLVNLNNGVTTNGSNTDERWTNWRLRNDDSQDMSYVQFDWKNNYTLSNVKLYHFTDNAGSVLPGDENVKFEYWDGSKWQEVETSHITQVSYLNGETPYGFIKPVTTNKLRVWVKAPRKGNTVGFTEVEVFPYVHVEPAKQTASLMSLSVNGKTLDVNKADSIYDIGEVDKVDISAIAEDNAAVTLARLSNNEYKVFVTSEDGKVNKVYTVHATVKASETSESSKPESSKPETSDKNELDAYKKETLALIEQMDSAINREEYTPVSYTKYASAWKALYNVLNTKDSTKEQVGEKLQLLSSALRQLEPVQPEPEKPGTDTTESDKPTEKPGTDTTESDKPTEKPETDTTESDKPTEKPGTDTTESDKPTENTGTDTTESDKPTENTGTDTPKQPEYEVGKAVTTDRPDFDISKLIEVEVGKGLTYDTPSFDESLLETPKTVQPKEDKVDKKEAISSETPSTPMASSEMSVPETSQLPSTGEEDYALLSVAALSVLASVGLIAPTTMKKKR